MYFCDSHACLLLADGEIINQIKMTNLALADIKELLKQQVGIICVLAVFKKQRKSTFVSTKWSEVVIQLMLPWQIKEIEFLKNTVMECEACGECDGRGKQTLTPLHPSVHRFICSVFRYGGDRASSLVRAQPLPPGGGVRWNTSGGAMWVVSRGHAGKR